MTDPKVVTVDQVDRSQLNQFLRKAYTKPKSEFLQLHGEWWHRGNQNRLVILVGDEVAAYCGLIPTKCLIHGQVQPAAWWVDLIVAPEFRGQGLQRLLDRGVRQMADLIFGFPNELAAKIHLKHGWGVRDDHRILMLPLRPTGVRSLRNVRGAPGFFLRLAARMVTPAAMLLRQRWSRYEPLTARSVESPDPDVLAEVFVKYRDDRMVTTCRDADFVRWRYLDCPYRSQLAFYVAGPSQCPNHFLVARHVNSQGVKATRILDVYGDLHDTEGLRDILRLTVRDAIRQGAGQVTAMTSIPELHSALRSIGFLFSAKAPFCWHSTSQPTMQSLGESLCYWTLADSDNDPPD